MCEAAAVLYGPQDRRIHASVSRKLLCVCAVMLPIAVSDCSKFAYIRYQNFMPHLREMFADPHGLRTGLNRNPCRGDLVKQIRECLTRHFETSLRGDVAVFIDRAVV
jgi:hypothetical protein